MATGATGAIDYTATGLAVGVTNSFAVTSYDASGLESGLSNELSVFVSASTPTPVLTATIVPSAIPTATLVPSATRTTTAVPSNTATATLTSSPTVTRSATPSASRTGTATLTSTPTSSPTKTTSPTATSTATRSQTPTSSATAAATKTSSPVATATATPTSTATPLTGAVTCGNTTFTSTGADIGDANMVQGPSCVTASNLAGYSVLSCVARVGSFTSGHIKCALYDDAGNKLCESPTTPTPMANAWNSIDLSTANCGTLAPNTRYWIAFTTDDNGLQWMTQEGTACTSLNYPSCANCSRFVSGQTFPTAPNPWGAVNANCQYSYYMNLRPNVVTPASTPTTTATRAATATATRTATPVRPTPTPTPRYRYYWWPWFYGGTIYRSTTLDVRRGSSRTVPTVSATPSPTPTATPTP